MKALRTFAFGSALALGVAAPALAQNPQEEAALRQSCSGDYMRLCSTFDPGSPEVEQCFKAKMKELTPQCQSAIAAFNKANPGGRKR